LSHNALDHSSIEQLASGLVASASVKRLFLLSTRTNDAAVHLLAPGLKINTLEELVLARNGLSQHGVSAVGDALKAGKGVTNLDLSVNPLGDDGTVAAAVLITEVRTLRALSLSSVQCHLNGARALTSTLLRKSVKLQSLRFAKNPHLGIVACFSVACMHSTLAPSL
ncbi:MAG: uncharacterized protein A8A55_3474, partial [Amphiamblys sp. WSBS2006]